MSLLLKRLLIDRQSKRYIWQWVTETFNKPDADRIETVGAERAAAEWLLKNGAAVKWTDGHQWLKDYNVLPLEDMNKRIKEIDATDSAITSLGFAHLNGLKSLDTFVVNNNGYIDDKAIELLGICSDSLTNVQIISCIGVTDKGVHSLTQLKNLKHLKLFDLPSVEDKDKCLNHLKSGLKSCEIDWKDVKPKK